MQNIYILYLQKVSTHVSLRGARKLTWVDTFWRCIKYPFHTTSSIWYKVTLHNITPQLVTSIFSFSNNVFSPFQNNFQIFTHIYFVICKCFQFSHVLKVYKELKKKKGEKKKKERKKPRQEGKTIKFDFLFLLQTVGNRCNHRHSVSRIFRFTNLSLFLYIINAKRYFSRHFLE